jgi:hypothetical protein
LRNEPSPCTEVQRVNLFKIADDTAKATLAVKFNELVDKRGLTQIEAAAISGIAQSKVSTPEGFIIPTDEHSAARKGGKTNGCKAASAPSR